MSENRATLLSRIKVLEAELSNVKARHRAELAQHSLALDDSMARHRAEVYTHDGLKRQIDQLKAERDEQMARASRAETLIAAYSHWYRHRGIT